MQLRVTELICFGTLGLISHYVFDLSVVLSFLVSCGVILPLAGVAFLRHRFAYRQRIRTLGERLISFRIPTSFGTPAPYSPWLQRNWYDAIVLTSEGREVSRSVVVQGFLFGLFHLSITSE